ncbi:hypothetical protein B6C97_01005 [Gilliamella apis]|uniref:hypothetical protein n=1 Tax=Gilliamella apis TaxID=1970738 RepID=UPI000A330207|nr:hypothetical protein [Gilliamella apis]OTQ39813.1 hypothetical protein B6C94_11115 [Gilliamella apis]OTQ40337.1 hypothetical protein B6D26_06290 [Gilliamella apis]OTQ46740.1 hypothetical protein B6C86_03255 [Gilliamella apis]OTQ63573.1 hypothetical protein B6C97_01005 [Gilliamella apis]
MVFILTVVVLQSISFANYALTTTTTNIIYGSAPYLTFDGGRTRITNTESLLGISLSDGRAFTPTTNNSSSTNPIELPVVGQSFNDIGMLVPRNTNSIALSSLIGTPYNYWGDDDGDGQGVNGVTATGSLNLSIVDKNSQAVAHNEVLTICRAPYKLTLSNGEGRLTTRYGVPNESRFSAGNATYYINPKASPVICYARPDLGDYTAMQGLSVAVWEFGKGFIPQSVTPSSYGLNFPTTGAHNLFFDLDISGVSQALSWAPVSHGGITATMTDSTSTSVRVTLTGPVATESQWESDNPGRIARSSLPQVFELVGRDSSGNAVVKYGFELKQWFVNRGEEYWNSSYTFSSASSWCNRIGYRLVKVMDLTNASCPEDDSGYVCRNYGNQVNALTATPSSPDHMMRRHIGAGFFTEWGTMVRYTGANFEPYNYWANDKTSDNRYYFAVDSGFGDVSFDGVTYKAVLCVYP